LPISQDEPSCPVREPDSAANRASADADAETEDANLGAKHLINWPWPAALLAHVPQRVAGASSSPVGGLLLVSPTAEGLDALESSGHALSALWVLAVDTDGPGALLGYRVEEITNLGSTTPDGRQLTVLRGPGDRLIAIEGDDLFVRDSASSNWKDSGRYKRGSASSET
jgi:hypothetical protein